MNIKVTNEGGRRQTANLEVKLNVCLQWCVGLIQC